LVARGDIDAQMSVCIDIADYKWLTGSEAAAYLAELATSAEPLHISIERLRRGLSPVKAHLLLEQVELRRRAREEESAGWISKNAASRSIPKSCAAS
jgi:hypothetical protein